MSLKGRIHATPIRNRLVFNDKPQSGSMLCGCCKQLGVRAIMFVPEGKPSPDASRFEKKSNLLQLCAPHDVASRIANDCRGSICEIYAGHFDIPAFMISVILFLASPSPSVW